MELDSIDLDGALLLPVFGLIVEHLAQFPAKGACNWPCYRIANLAVNLYTTVENGEPDEGAVHTCFTFTQGLSGSSSSTVLNTK